jgi:hypothetical protein
MSARKSMFSVLALYMLLAGGAIIASTDVEAQTVDRPSRYRAKAASQVQPRYDSQPSDPLNKARLKSKVNPCGSGFHVGGDGKCHIN